MRACACGLNAGCVLLKRKDVLRYVTLLWNSVALLLIGHGDIWKKNLFFIRNSLSIIINSYVSEFVYI